MARQKAQVNSIGVCHCCRTPLTEENSRPALNSITNYSSLCLDCESELVARLARIQGNSMALFQACAFFDVPLHPILLENSDYQKLPPEEIWIFYLEKLAESGLDVKDGELQGWATGECYLLKCFGANLTARDFARYIEEEKKALASKAGTPEQRERWGELPIHNDIPMTTEVYDELDRQFRIRAKDFQTLSLSQEDTLMEVAKDKVIIAYLKRNGAMKSAAELEKSIDLRLASEQMRRKDEKPAEAMRLDALQIALEKAHLMNGNKFLTLDETLDVIGKHFFAKKKYAYGTDIVNKALENNYNNNRRNADLVMVDMLPEDMAIVDELGECETEDSEETRKRKKFANFIPTQFEKTDKKEDD